MWRRLQTSAPLPKQTWEKGFQRLVVQLRQGSDCGGSRASLMLQSNVVSQKLLGEVLIWGHQSVPIITACAQPRSTVLLSRTGRRGWQYPSQPRRDEFVLRAGEGESRLPWHLPGRRGQQHSGEGTGWRRRRSKPSCAPQPRVFPGSTSWYKTHPKSPS